MTAPDPAAGEPWHWADARLASPPAVAASTGTSEDATCKATSFGVPTDDHVSTCLAPATEEWLDLTGRWIPVCDAHGRGRGVPEDRLRPLATGTSEDVEALAKVILAERLAARELPNTYMDDAELVESMKPRARAVLASDWLAAREAAARAEERERIAQAIEEAGRRKPRDPQWMWATDAAVAARIAREGRP